MQPTGWSRVVRRLVVLVAVAGGSAGCTVGPNFVPPDAPFMPHWKRHSGAYELSERKGPVVEWWRVFRDPTLDRLVAIARAQNLTLQEAGLRIYQARAQLGIAIGNLFPQTQKLAGGYKRQTISKNIGIIKDVDRMANIVTDISDDVGDDRSVSLNTTFHNWEVGFDATWEIDIWGQIRRGIQSADANLVAQVANYDDALITLTGDVATAYVTIRELQEELKLAKENVKLQTDGFDLTVLRLKDGVTTELDEEQAKSLLNQTKAEIPGLEANLAQAKNSLAVLLGVTPDEVNRLLGPVRPIPTAPVSVGVGIPTDLLRRRPDIRAAEATAAAQAFQIGVAKADFYPAIAISGAMGFKASDLGQLFQAGSKTGFINPGFSWNVLNYGRIRNNVRVQDALYQQAIVNYQNTVLSAYSEVETGLSAFLDAQRQAHFLGEAVTASHKASKISFDQYRDGTADYQRVLNSQQSLLRNEQRLAQVKANIVINLISVYKALGGGWQTQGTESFVSEANKYEMRSRTNWGRLLDPSAIPGGPPPGAPPGPRAAGVDG